MIALSIYKTSLIFATIKYVCPIYNIRWQFGNKFISSFVCKPMYVIVLMNALMRKVIWLS